MNTEINIRLPEELLKALKYRAIEEKKSVNQLIREAIEQTLQLSTIKKDQGEDPFDRVIGIAKSSTRDGSSKHDRYLYGKSR